MTTTQNTLGNLPIDTKVTVPNRKGMKGVVIDHLNDTADFGDLVKIRFEDNSIGFNTPGQCELITTHGDVGHDGDPSNCERCHAEHFGYDVPA
jgi:hypothetical protein